ncbi:MAG: hypothetical protein IT385_29440 [Deltaproteobacteria bacterium]|nr:hypothetical protein [Deltaproteobacteria bacterium]
MSIQPPETTPPAAPKLADRIITVVGILLFVSGLVVARIFRDAPDAHLGADLGDILKSFGTALAAIGGALPIPEFLRRLAGAGGGKALVAIVAGGLLSAGSLLGGCSFAREIRAERSVDFQVERGPPCIVKVLADGDLVHTTRGEGIRCGVTIDGEARP